MHLSVKRVLSAAVALLIVGPALVAQTPTQPGGRLPPTTPANPFPSPLYRMQDVSKSLNLTPAQINRLNQSTDQLQTRYGKDYSGINSLPADQRTARTQELMNNYNRDWSKSANDIFNDQQRAHYGQLELQYRGLGALNDPNVQKQLNLTEQQRGQLRGLADWNQQQLQDINKIGATDSTQAQKLYDTYRQESQNRLNKFLTPEQQQTWRTMTGDPYTFKPTFNTTGTPRR